MWGFISRTALIHQQQIVNIFDNSQQFAKSIFPLLGNLCCKLQLEFGEFDLVQSLRSSVVEPIQS